MFNESTENLIHLIKYDMKKSLSEKRFLHCVRVMEKACELANIYNVEAAEFVGAQVSAALAGLTHDIAKEIPYLEAMEIIKNNNIEVDEIELANPGLMHGPLGAFLVKERYGLCSNIQNAIKLHTRTSKDMTMLDKIVYVADKIEDGRKNNNYNIQVERELAKTDIDATVFMIIDNNIIHLLEKSRLVHPNSIITTNFLKMNLYK